MAVINEWFLLKTSSWGPDDEADVLLPDMTFHGGKHESKFTYIIIEYACLNCFIWAQAFYR